MKIQRLKCQLIASAIGGCYVEFPDGIAGYDGKDFIIVKLPIVPGLRLYDIDNPGVQIILINPQLFDPNFSISHEVIEGDSLILVILSLKDTLEETCADLSSPLILNEEKPSKQIILPDYPEKAYFPIKCDA